MQSLLSGDQNGDCGKHLVAFSFSDDRSHQLERTASSSRVSWQATRGFPLCRDIYARQGWASWSGAATSGALVNFTTDPDGLCMHVRLRCGRAYAILGENGSLSGKHEGMVLEPNSRLYD
jgi:hypothetical protein